MEFIKIYDNIYNEDKNSLEEGFYVDKSMGHEAVCFVGADKDIWCLGTGFETFMDKYLEVNKPKPIDSVSVETMLKAIAVSNGNVKDVEL